MIKHFNLKITGKVQGVWFRASTQKKALELGLTGFVSNRVDKSVYVEVEGTEVDLKKFMAWCKKGPPLAKVKNIEIEESEMKDFSTFEIQR